MLRDDALKNLPKLLFGDASAQYEQVRSRVKKYSCPDMKNPFAQTVARKLISPKPIFS